MLPAFIVFGLSSFNLFSVLHANIAFLLEHGDDAVMDGAINEIFKLLAYGMISMVAYVVFKACEKQMVDLIVNKQD